MSRAPGSNRPGKRQLATLPLALYSMEKAIYESSCRGEALFYGLITIKPGGGLYRGTGLISLALRPAAGPYFYRADGRPERLSIREHRRQTPGYLSAFVDVCSWFYRGLYRAGSNRQHTGQLPARQSILAARDWGNRISRDWPAHDRHSQTAFP